MTWEELAAHIEVMDEEQKKTDVTLCRSNEFFPVKSLEFADSRFCDVLDENHPYLLVLS